MTESALTIYARAEGYYLVASAKTAAGLLQHVAEPPTFSGIDAPPSQIGRLALVRLSEPRPRTPHPERDEWSDVRRTTVQPVIRAAKVASWREFITNTAMVEVARAGDAFKVMPMTALARPQGAYEPAINEEIGLVSPTPEDLGLAVLRAFTTATPA